MQRLEKQINPASSVRMEERMCSFFHDFAPANVVMLVSFFMSVRERETKGEDRGDR